MISIAKSIYLIAYNSTCAYLWGYIGYLVLFNDKGGILPNRQLDTITLWNCVSPWLMLTQTLALMECIHSLLGVVRNSFITTSMQIVSRLHVVWIVWRLVPTARYDVAAVTAIMAWSAVEIIRYTYYAMNHMTNNKKFYMFTWLRYSAFILLYPIGIFSETRCIWLALPYFKDQKALRAYPVPMPNLLNFEADLYVLYWFILLAYIPGSIHLYGHMMKQRSKVLSKDENKKTQ